MAKPRQQVRWRNCDLACRPDELELSACQGRHCCRLSLALKTCTMLLQLAPNLADATRCEPEPAGDRSRFLSRRQHLGDARCRGGQFAEPIVEVDPHGGNVGGCGMAVLDHYLAPSWPSVLLVQALDENAAAALAPRGRDVVDVNRGTDGAASADAAHSKSSQGGRVGQLFFTELDQSA